MNDFKEIKEAIYGSESITILTRDNPSQDAAGAASALFFSLKNIKKIVNIPALPEIPGPIALPAKKEGRKTFLISLKKNISEIYYEKKDGEVKLYIKPEKESIGLEDLSFKTVAGRDIDDFPGISPAKKPADLLIALGVENFQDIEKTIEENPDRYLPRIKIINIDNGDLNQKYADFNLVKKYPSLSQACAYLLKNLGPDFINENAANALLYGLASALKDSKPIDRQNSALFLSWLAKKGADFSLWTNRETTASKKNLLVETLKKMEFFEKTGLCCSFLAKKNFESAGAPLKDLGFVIAEIKNRLALPSLLLLWEAAAKNGPAKIMGVFYSDREKDVEEMKRRFEGERKGSGFLFLSRQADLASAKKEALDCVKIHG